jgi:competence protein ComEC
MLFAWLHRYPFLRLLCPLVVGIYCGDELFFQRQSGRIASGVSLLFLLSFGGLIFFFNRKHYSGRWLFGSCLLLFCFTLGAGLMNRELRQAESVFPQRETAYRLIVTEQPQVKEKSVLCRVLLIEQIDSVSGRLALDHKALLYFTKDSLSEHLRSGDELLVYTKLSPPVNNGNPDEFDYARFLFRRQVAAIGFAYADNWKVISRGTMRSFRQQAMDCRESVLSVYRRLGFRGDDLAVLSALTIGYKEELSEDIRETYSISGASHVLALSGLHIGFLYLLLCFCLRWLPERWRIVALLRTLVILLSLWTFAFFTGLSASVVRSVVMFSLFALARLSGRTNFSLNTLLIAAFFMLLCRPSWLFDVGFQLSFCAVAAILLIQPCIYRLIPVAGSRIGRYIWGLMSVSIAAQIGTAPLVLLYFSRFSTHFLLTNLLVIPLVSLIMYVAVIMLLLNPLPFLQELAAAALRRLVGALNNCVRWIEQLPWASVDGVWVYIPEVFGFYLALILGGWYLFSRTGKRLAVCLSCIFLVCIYHVSMRVIDRPRQSIVFYNVRNCPVVHCVASNGSSWLAYADSLPDESRLRRAVSKRWNRQGLKPPQPVTADYTCPALVYDHHLLSFSGCRVCVLNDNYWRNKTTLQPLSIDYLYVCKGYDGHLRELADLFVIHNVILDASLSDRRLQAYKMECQQQGVHFISLSDEGSTEFLL